MAVRVSSQLKSLAVEKRGKRKKNELEVVWGKNLLLPSVVGIANLGFYLVFCMSVLLVVDTGIFFCINTDVGSMLNYFCFCWIIITCFELFFFYSCCIFLAVRAMLPLISYDMLSDTFCYKL